MLIKAFFSNRYRSLNVILIIKRVSRLYASWHCWLTVGPTFSGFFFSLTNSSRLGIVPPSAPIMWVYELNSNLKWNEHIEIQLIHGLGFFRALCLLLIIAHLTGFLVIHYMKQSYCPWWGNTSCFEKTLVLIIWDRLLICPSCSLI